MKPSLILWPLARIALLFGITTVASAQEWALPRLENSPRHLEWVTVERDGREVECFIAYPEVAEPATAVVVIHEIFGLSDWVRGVTDQLAEAGYIAIAPDLLSGAAPGGGGTREFASGDAVRTAIRTLPQEQILADLDAVAAYVKKLPACNGKVTVAGFCWGGTQTFEFVMHNSGLAAGFPFYGTGPGREDAERVARITCPLFGFYAENDARINTTLPATEAVMQSAGKRFEPVTYEGAGHGFMRAGEAPDATDANRRAREAGWKRWKALLQDVTESE